jgi:inosine triphosphate pyrophosphatase
MTLYFITGNTNKFREISAIISGLKQLNLELDEIQSLDPHAVIEHKLHQAAQHHDGEFIVEDTSLILNCLGGLPGTFIKWFEHTLTVEGIADLALHYPDHSATARVTIGYRDRTGEIHYFVGEQTGEIVAPRGTKNTFGWNSIFQPAGHNLTFAEMSIEEKNAISMRGIAAHKLASHLANPSR